MKAKIVIVIIWIFFSFNCTNYTAKNENVNLLKNAQPTLTKTPESTPAGKVNIAPAPETLTTSLILRRKENESPVESDFNFVKGDGVRLNVSVVEKGFLYILYKGSSGQKQVLFPNRAYFNGKNELEANKVLTVPNKGWFFFDAKTGTETIFVVYSKTQDSNLTSGSATDNLAMLEKQRNVQGNIDSLTTEKGDLVRVIELKHR